MTEAEMEADAECARGYLRATGNFAIEVRRCADPGVAETSLRLIHHEGGAGIGRQAGAVTWEPGGRWRASRMRAGQPTSLFRSAGLHQAIDHVTRAR